MKKLTVPENIPLRWELFRGFGKPETIRTGIITGIVLAGSILFCMVSTWEFKQMAATLAVIFTMFICVNVFVRMDGNNQSIYNFLKCGLRYRREQQTFWYKREEKIYASFERKA